MTHERLRLAYALHGSPPRECADHAADYAARLVRLEPSTAAHILRDSQARMWTVIKRRHDEYIVGGPRYTTCTSAAEVAALMEETPHA